MHILDEELGEGVASFCLKEGTELSVPGVTQLGAFSLENRQINVPIRQICLQRHRTKHKCLHLQRNTDPDPAPCGSPWQVAERRHMAEPHLQVLAETFLDQALHKVAHAAPPIV